MLNNIDATKQKTVIGNLKLFKVVSLDEVDPTLLKDPHITGESFRLGEEVFRPVEIVSDGYDTFVYKGLVAFDSLVGAWDCIRLLERHYPSMADRFTVAEISLSNNTTFYTGYHVRKDTSIKIYAVDSFKVERIVEEMAA
ncbi:hypothetical protein [Stenotrophomonas phage RAS14]